MNKDKELQYDVNSWHYRLGKYTWHWRPDSVYWRYTAPTNLCPYMRKILYAFICGPLFFMWRMLPSSIKDHELLAQILFTYGVLVHIAYFILGFVTGGIITDNDYENGEIIKTTKYVLEWWYGWAFYLASIGVVAAVGGIILGMGALIDIIKDKRRHDPNAGKTLEIFHDMIEANHEKICPRIRFVDKNKPVEDTKQE